MANNDWDRDRGHDQDRDRDRDSERYENRPRGQGEQQRRYPDIGRSNEYGSHAGWGGQGFNQGSFGEYGGQGERLYTQHGGQGWGSEHGYYNREGGGGMSTYQGQPSGNRNEGSSFDRDRERGRGSERWGGQGGYGQGSEGSNQDRGRERDFGGRAGGWGGDPREAERARDLDRDRQPYTGGQSGWTDSQPGWRGTQGWVGAQHGWGSGSMPQSSDPNRRGHYGRGPKGWQRSDERIREDISERLADHPDIDASEIEIDVKGGEVTLKGSVEDRHIKRLAEDVAERVSGVRDVHNNIRVSRGFWSSIKDTLTGETGDESRRDSSGQPETMTGDVVSAGHSGAPTHTITPSPQQMSSQQTQPAGKK